MKLLATMAIFAGMVLFGCGDQSTEPTRPTTGEVVFTPADLPTSLSGTYIGVISGQKWYHPVDKDYSFEVVAWFTDSSFDWTSTRLSGVYREWGGGPFTIVGDSLHTFDCYLRLWYRDYVTLEGAYRFSFDGELLTLIRTVNDSTIQTAVFEKRPIIGPVMSSRQAP